MSESQSVSPRSLSFGIFLSRAPVTNTAFIALLVHIDNEAAHSGASNLCQVLAAPLALGGYIEEFCGLQDGINSGR